MIGGSDGINAMLYIRGNRFDYDRWKEEGINGWGYDDVLPYFEKSITPVGNKTHPKGYITLNEFPQFDEDIFSMIFEGGKEMGIQELDEFKEGSYIGYSHVKGTIENGFRLSTAKGYLAKVAQRPNLKVIKNAQVTKLIFDHDGQSVKSVEFILKQQKFRVPVKREVILSAGAIESPKLLMLSGVGPQNNLQNLNIPVIKNLPIGENLQDHVTVQLFLRLSGNIPDKKQLLDNIYQYLLHKKGPLTSHSTSSLTGFINTNTTNNSSYPNIEFHHFVKRRRDFMGLKLFFNGFKFKLEYRPFLTKNIEKYDILIVFILLSHPKSRGKLTLKSALPQDSPTIKANYLKHPQDIQDLLQAIKYIMNLEQTQAFQKKQVEILQVPIEECDRYRFKSEKYWSCYISYFTSTSYNQVGTVKMGSESDKSSCVDSKLKIKGVKNLRVIDASVMPHIPSGNTNAPTIMIAEKGADLVKEDWN